MIREKHQPFVELMIKKSKEKSDHDITYPFAKLDVKKIENLTKEIMGRR